MNPSNISFSPSFPGAPERLVKLFSAWAGSLPQSAVRLLGAGSDRRYWRLKTHDKSAIGVETEDVSEARAFVALAEMFHANGVEVPEIYGVDADFSAYLQQDLGSEDLLSLLKKDAGMPIAEKCMRSLARMQTVAQSEWSGIVGFPPMSARLIGWDLNYFKYEYLKPSGVHFSEEALEDDFDRLKQALLSIPDCRLGFMMRDCQSRNVMVKDSEPFWIDFQGGRLGPALYDAVSFVYQAKAGFSAKERSALLELYADSFCHIRGLKKEEFLSDLPVLRLFRCLQVLGAYGFRGLVQKRAHFIESIPGALENLRELVEEGALKQYPEMRKVAEALVIDSRFVSRSSDRLRVSVFSFSYKKGYPEDYSGNGGGFMFDCRALHNPGRYEEYKSLTGLDLPVVEFLESRGEVGAFLEAASALVIPAVDRYLKRGFTSLQVGFGCTGGQHRSVYCAHRLSELIAEKFPGVEVLELHRERGITLIHNNV